MFVLVVEDEPIILMLAVSIVEDAGYEALEARSADEAVRILESRSDVRIVFTDIEMPGSMDGLKLARAIHWTAPHSRLRRRGRRISAIGLQRVKCRVPDFGSEGVQYFNSARRQFRR